MRNELLDEMIRFESGAMSAPEIVSFFQGMINTGLCWRLQGSYGRAAHNLIRLGACHLPKQPIDN